jgi:hypothetical protein
MTSLMYYPGIFLEGLWKTTRMFRPRLESSTSQRNYALKYSSLNCLEIGAIYMSVYKISTPGACMRRSNERSHYKGRASPNKTHPRRTAHVWNSHGRPDPPWQSSHFAHQQAPCQAITSPTNRVSSFTAILSLHI